MDLFDRPARVLLAMSRTFDFEADPLPASCAMSIRCSTSRAGPNRGARHGPRIDRVCSLPAASARWRPATTITLRWAAIRIDQHGLPLCRQPFIINRSI